MLLRAARHVHVVMQGYTQVQHTQHHTALAWHAARPAGAHAHDYSPLQNTRFVVSRGKVWRRL